MWRTGIAAATVLCFACAVRADFTPPTPPNLQIRGEEVTADSELSCWVTLGIENTGVPDKLAGWQLVLQIVPVDDPHHATVLIPNINDESYPHPDVTTPHYVFSSSDYFSHLSYLDSAYGDVYYFGDMASDPLVGEEVPASGKNLIRFQLTSSDIGRFNILAVPDDGTGTYSAWVAADSTLRSFDVVAVDGQPQWAVASVVFGTPEPHSAAILSSGLVVAVLYWQLFRKGRRLGSVVPLLRRLDVLQVKTVDFPVPR
jgi:hypothetical protein